MDYIMTKSKSKNNKKQLEKTMAQVNTKSPNRNVCEIPNYSTLIQNYKTNHLEYHIVLNRCPELD